MRGLMGDTDGLSADNLRASLPTAATRVRWVIVALLVGYSFMTWFNRVGITVAYNARIEKQYEEISEIDIGLINSTFGVVYALCMIPGGWLIDRFGAKTA